MNYRRENYRFAELPGICIMATKQLFTKLKPGIPFMLFKCVMER